MNKCVKNNQTNVAKILNILTETLVKIKMKMARMKKMKVGI